MPQRIAIIDDDRETVKILETLLRHQGFEVSTAMDGKAALDIIQTEAPDLAIVDLMLPYIDGFELIALIRKNYPIPILVMSARSTDADIDRALSLGVEDYMTKPFQSDHLIKKIKQILDKQR